MSNNKEQKVLEEFANVLGINFFEKQKEEQQKLKLFESILKVEPKKQIEEEKPKIEPIIPKNEISISVPEVNLQEKVVEYISTQSKKLQEEFPIPEAPLVDKNFEAVICM